MQIKKIYFSTEAPACGDVIWAKPVEDGFALYLNSGGAWYPLKVVDDNSTSVTFDDKAKAVITVTNINKLSNKQCEALNVGDQVIKKTGNQMHLYTVTYKEDKQGLCLCYFDAENVETIPYDWNNSTHKWEVGTPTYTSIAAST